MQFDVICWSKIFKDNKIVVFEKLTSAHLQQIAREIMSLDNYLNEKAPQKVQTNEILAARAICNLHSCYNFALVLYEKCTRFQPMRRA